MLKQCIILVIMINKEGKEFFFTIWNVGIRGRWSGSQILLWSLEDKQNEIVFIMVLGGERETLCCNVICVLLLYMNAKIWMPC